MVLYKVYGAIMLSAVCGWVGVVCVCVWWWVGAVWWVCVMAFVMTWCTVRVVMTVCLFFQLGFAIKAMCMCINISLL